MENTGKLTGGRTADTKFNFGKKGWGLILIAMLSYVVFMGFDNALNFIVPAFAEKLSCSQTELFMFSTIGGWASVLAIIVFGALQHKIGVKKVLIVSLIISLIGALVWANAGNVVMYAVGAILTKAMGTVFTMLSFAEIGSNWFPTKKGNYMGVITIGVIIAGVVANGPVGTVIKNVGVKQGIMVLAIVNVIVLILNALFVKVHPEEAGAYPDNNKNMTPEQAQAVLTKVKEYQKSSEWTVPVCLKNKNVWLLSISLGMLLMVAMGIMSQTVTAALSFGHDPAFSQIASVVCAPFALIGTIAAGKLDQKMGTKRITILIFILAAAACLIGGFFGKTVPGLLIFVCAIAMAVSGGNNMVMSYSATIWGRYDFSTPYVVVLTISQIISAFGYVVISGLAKAGNGVYTLACLGGAAIIAVGLVFCLMCSDNFVGRSMEEMNPEA